MAYSHPFVTLVATRRMIAGVWTAVANFATVVLASDAPVISRTAAAPVGSYQFDLLEGIYDANGELQTHRSTVAFAIATDPPIDGDGTLATWPADLTAVVVADPDGAALLPVPFDPGDRARIKVDLAGRCFGRAIDTIEFVDFDQASKDLGLRVGAGVDRPILDKTNQAAAVHVECDPASQQSVSFAGSGVLVTPTIRVRFTNGDSAEVSFPFQARQL